MGPFPHSFSGLVIWSLDINSVFRGSIVVTCECSVFLAFCATLLSTVFVMPLLGVGILKVLDVDAPSMLAVYVLIACPGGSFSNMAANIFGANVALNAALTCACVLVSLLMVPIACVYLLPIVLSGTDVAQPPSISPST